MAHEPNYHAPVANASRPSWDRRQAHGRNLLNARRLQPKKDAQASPLPSGFALDAVKGFGLFRRVLKEGKN
jgi:hypothetical protein